MRFKTFLTEVTEAHESKLFTMVIGGSASGKSWYVQKRFKNIPVIDVDDYTKKLSGGDWEKARKVVSKAIALADKDIEALLKADKSFISVGTGSSVAGVLNKLKKAKEHGYKTKLILVSVSPEVAKKRNELRASKGDRNLMPDYKVELTNKNAKENFKTLSKDFDESEIVKT